MKVFFLLKPNSLVIFPQKDQPQQLVFPPQIVKYQEIIDQKEFEKLLGTFFSQFSKNKAILFLSDELVFAKTVSVQPQTILEEEKQKFIDHIPLPSSNIAINTIQTKSNLYFFATNSSLYTTIIAAAQQQQINITKAIPLLLFGPNISGMISFDTLSHLTKEKKILEEGDFLKSDTSHNKIRKLPVRQLLMLFVSLLIFSGALTFGAVSLGLLSLPNQKPTQKAKTVSTQTNPTAKPDLSQTEEATDEERGNIKIQILNGSGVAGQAATIQTQLETIGFSNIQIGNAEGPTSNTSIVVFSKKVSKTYQESILAELKKTLTNIETKQIPEDTSDYDVSITTGQES